MRTLLTLLALAGLVACGPEDATSPRSPLDAGAAAPRDGGPTLPPADGGATGPDAGAAADAGASRACSTDCECPGDGRCSPESPFTGRVCLPGPGACHLPARAEVAGSYATHYQLDVGAFARHAGDLATLLRVLDAVLEGRGSSCVAEGSLESRLLCLVLGLAAARAPPPPWVGQLVALLSDLFRLGGSPLRAQGVLTLSEAGDRLSATETWSALWATYDGQVLDLMQAPVLGAAGTLTVSLPPFTGSRTDGAVRFGPRRVDFDVDRLLVRLLEVAISAASGGQVRDVGGLLDALVCRPLVGGARQDYLGCLLLVRTFASRFELASGLGGLSLASQQAPVLPGGRSGRAASLGTAADPGTLQGQLSNGLVSGALGPFPRSAWYGTRN